MKTLIQIILMLFITASVFAQTVYDPPSAYTSHYRLRMWDEGDRPGADSVNQNLKDIDAQLYSVNLKADRVYTEGHFFTAANSFTSNTNSFNGSEYKLNGTNINTAGTLSNVSYLSANNTFTGHQTFADHFTVEADDATSYINMTGTDNALLKFNGNTFLTWNAAQMTIAGNISATGYKLNGTNINTAGTLTNVAYLSANNTFTGYNEFADHITLVADNSTSYINMLGSDNALLKFNNNTFLTWDATQMTVPGIISAKGWKTGSTTTYMTSAFSNPDPSGYYVATVSGGIPTTQLDKTSLTINGITHEFLIVPK